MTRFFKGLRAHTRSQNRVETTDKQSLARSSALMSYREITRDGVLRLACALR